MKKIAYLRFSYFPYVAPFRPKDIVQPYATQIEPDVACDSTGHMVTPILNQIHCFRGAFPQSWLSIFRNRMSASIILRIEEFRVWGLLGPGRKSADSAGQQNYVRFLGRFDQWESLYANIPLGKEWSN